MKSFVPSWLLPSLALSAGIRTGVKFECPGDGLWPDPDNCQLFYDCANDHPFLESCPSGTLYDPELQSCNYADQVDCGDRPLPGSTRPPTTPGPSTASPVPSTSVEVPATTATMDTPSTTPVPATTFPTMISSEASEPQPTTTFPHTGPTGPYPGLPGKVLGMYILLADDTEDGYHSDNADWEPLLHPYQQTGANVLFFTFINPATMDVPVAFRKLAASRGTNADGAVPADTRISFAIGGYAYSINPNPWDWLTSREKAEAMAVKVARWRDDYGIDGIDLDLEEGAGSQQAAGPNMVHFIRKIKSIHPDLIISQPTYGYPQIQGEIDVINASWEVGGASNGLADSIGLMVYEGTQALQYVKNYAEGSSQWQGFPIHVDVPRPQILLGCKGSSGRSTIATLASESIKQDLLGVMVWFCSVRNGLVYSSGWDCSDSEESMAAYTEAMEYLNNHS